MFSRAWFPLHVFPRLVTVACFPALGSRYMFSRSWYRLPVFLRFLISSLRYLYLLLLAWLTNGFGYLPVKTYESTKLYFKSSVKHFSIHIITVGGIRAVFGNRQAKNSAGTREYSGSLSSWQCQLLSNFETTTAGSVSSRRPEVAINWYFCFPVK